MKFFGSRKRTREKLLKGVYEENLRIVGRLRKGGSRRRFRFLTPGGAFLLLGAVVLLGHTSPLNPFPWSDQPSAEESASSPLAGSGAGGVGADTGTVLIPGVRPHLFRGEGGVDLQAEEYRSLASGGKIREVFDLSVKTIMIDPGHGGPEASGAVGQGGTPEKVINLDIAQRLRTLLQRDTDYTILMTREEDLDVPLRHRVEMANAARADLFISIHMNALPSKPLDIIETYYFGPTKDRKVLALAEEVNDGSSYSYSEYNKVIREITNQLKFQESRRLARSIQDTLFANMKRKKEDLLDYGVKRAPFVVLLGVEMPAVLVEVACLSNLEEENRLKDHGYRESIARYIEMGIIRYLNQNRSGTS
jgi:N-acetylmuramoyl-L-alanine amidase